MYQLSKEHYEACMAALGEAAAERMRQEAHAALSAKIEHCDQVMARLLAEPWSIACSNLGSGGPAWRWDGDTITWNLDLTVVLLEVEPDPKLNTHINDIHQLYARAIIETVAKGTADRIAAAVAEKFRDMWDVCRGTRESIAPMHPNTLRWGPAADDVDEVGEE